MKKDRDYITRKRYQLLNLRLKLENQKLKRELKQLRKNEVSQNE